MIQRVASSKMLSRIKENAVSINKIFLIYNEDKSDKIKPLLASVLFTGA